MTEVSVTGSKMSKAIESLLNGSAGRHSRRKTMMQRTHTVALSWFDLADL